MPVRIRITFLFTALVFAILSLVCCAVYSIAYNNRVASVKARLINRSITIGRLLSQSETFHPQLVAKIDSFMASTFSHRAMKAYDYLDANIFYVYENTADSISVDKSILDEARIHKIKYFTIGQRDAVAYHYTDNRSRFVLVSAAYDEIGQHNLQELATILALSFIGGVAIAFACGFIFSKGLLNPLRRIADEVNEISAHNLTRRIPAGIEKDEWHYLTGTLNELLNRLQEGFEVQRRFISNASHELSTPLTAISSQLEVSLQRERDAGEYRKVMQSIYQDVRNMSKLTQTLLQFAKASGNSGGIEIHSVRMDEVLMRLPSEIVKANKCYMVKLQFEQLPEEEESLLVSGNEELLFTAIKNIVVNACKYSDNHEAIIRLSVKDHSIIIAVEDTGAGIPKEELENIFEPFYRVDESRHGEGFGLGLALANRIIKLHKGRVQVRSQLGTGTTFTIVLPASGNGI